MVELCTALGVKMSPQRDRIARLFDMEGDGLGVARICDLLKSGGGAIDIAYVYKTLTRFQAGGAVVSRTDGPGIKLFYRTDAETGSRQSLTPALWELCVRAGLHLSPAQRLLADLIEDSDQPLSVRDMEDRLGVAVGAGRDCLYRTLRRFEQVGVVARAFDTGGRRVFSKAGSGKAWSTEREPSASARSLCAKRLVRLTPMRLRIVQVIDDDFGDGLDATQIWRCVNADPVRAFVAKTSVYRTLALLEGAGVLVSKSDNGRLAYFRMMSGLAEPTP